MNDDIIAEVSRKIMLAMRTTLYTGWKQDPVYHNIIPPRNNPDWYAPPIQIDRYNGLVIHSPKEIDFDFTLINSNERSKAIKEVVINILNKNINNNFDDIKMLLGVKVWIKV